VIFLFPFEVRMQEWTWKWRVCIWMDCFGGMGDSHSVGDEVQVVADTCGD
jgi:hypothetical protein